MTETLLAIAQQAMETAKKGGASAVETRVSKSRNSSLEWRDGKLETVQESISKSLGIRLFINGKYSSNGTSDLRPEAIKDFIRKCILMTDQLEPDPFRSLADPALYLNRPTVDLELFDTEVSAIPPETKRQAVKDLEDDARSADSSGRIVSVATSWEDSDGESVMINSNGFSGSSKGSSVWISAETVVKDSDGRRPEEWSMAGARFMADLPVMKNIGVEATKRALAQIGTKKVKSRKTHVLVENRAAGRIAMCLLGGPLSAASLQQKRSFLEGVKDKQVGSKLLTVTDNPLIIKGFGSRLFDGEGISSRKMPLFEKGVLRNYYIDTYYGKKLDMKPTTGGQSNLDWNPGTRNRDSIIKSIKDGILITSFLGGNSNDATGDFSLGIRGFLIKNGVLEHPISEMNMTGNHMHMWQRLVEVGNDPYPYSTSRCPSLLFDSVDVSGE